MCGMGSRANVVDRRGNSLLVWLRPGMCPVSFPFKRGKQIPSDTVIGYPVPTECNPVSK